MNIRFFEVPKNLVNKHLDINYTEKLICEYEMNHAPQIGALVCIDMDAWRIVDVGYSFDEKGYDMFITMIKED